MINSVSNAKVKYVMNLQKKSKFREQENIFVVEGIKMFMETPKHLIEKVYVTETFLDSHKELFENVEYETVTDRVFEQMSDTKTPQGVLVLVKMQKRNISDIAKCKSPYIIVAEDLQDPGNLGTIVRTAEGAGIDGIILSKNTVDIYNPKTIRSTMGSVYRVPVYVSEDIVATIKELQKMGVSTYAAHLSGEKYYSDCDYKSATAFVIGNESKGISREAAKACDNLIKIPMKGEVESLNAAIAAAILMYEGAKQRQS
ncbi:MAG: RNA methyltransferase [Lachnospira sp.]|nr:RNA methyltransferase [Lachnospira sp.]